MNFILVIRAVLSLLPLIIDAVKTLEAAFPASGQGASKLTAIRAIIESGYNTANEVSVTFEQLWPVIQSTVSAIVALANSTGLFKK